MFVKEVAHVSGVSVRTLHHYDAIGLLVPSTTTESGYRVYSNSDLATLQQILFFKELGFPLKEIKRIIMDEQFNQLEALEMQRNLLYEKTAKFHEMIQTIDETIDSMKGDQQMTNEARFKSFRDEGRKYEQEARERWGNAAIDESHHKLGALSNKDGAELMEQWDVLMKRMAKLIGQPTESQEVQTAIGDWHQFLNNNFYTYSYEAFQGLGQMYVADERFRENMNQYGVGLAEFMSEAIEVYVSERKK